MTRATGGLETGMGTPSPRYAAEFKQKAVELYGKSGTTYAEVARGLGCDPGSLSDWVKKADAADFGTGDNPFQMAEGLRRRVARIMRERGWRGVAREDVERVLEAGVYAANAGGGKRSMVVAVHNAELAAHIGRMNMAGFSRTGLAGSYVSRDQPSVIDDASIKNGFYDAPTVLCIFCQERFLFSVADAFAIAQNMALEAHALGLGSCIVSRAEKTFVSDEGQELLKSWDVPEGYICKAFATLDYCDGPYPAARSRRDGRALIID